MRRPTHTVLGYLQYVIIAQSYSNLSSPHFVVTVITILKIKMSKSLPAPWLRSTILELLSDNNRNRSNKSFVNYRARVVQVISTNVELEFIRINDKVNHVTVMLTRGCLDDLTEKGIQLSELKNTFIKLETFHFSTPIQSGGHRDEKKLVANHVSLPLALQCSKLSLLGGDDCEILGEPVDLNHDPMVRESISKLQYIEMVQRLAAKQFPEQNVLPNYGQYPSNIIVAINNIGFS